MKFVSRAIVFVIVYCNAVLLSFSFCCFPSSLSFQMRPPLKIAQLKSVDGGICNCVAYLLLNNSIHEACNKGMTLIACISSCEFVNCHQKQMQSCTVTVDVIAIRAVPFGQGKLPKRKLPKASLMSEATLQYTFIYGLKLKLLPYAMQRKANFNCFIKNCFAIRHVPSKTFHFHFTMTEKSGEKPYAKTASNTCRCHCLDCLLIWADPSSLN